MGNIAELSVAIEPLAPHHKVGEVGEIFLDERYDRFLSLPVVRDGRPVGTISRSHMQKIFMSRYGRELQGNNPIERFMNPVPLVVPVDHSMEQASHYVTRNISFPITEDFIVSHQDEYHGVGSVIDLLRGMEGRLTTQNQSLAQAYQKLKASQAQLVQTEKMASLGQMVAGVAHEINTPLGYVRNNVEMAQDAYGRLEALSAAYETLIGMMQSPEVDEAAMHAHFSELQGMSEAFAATFQREDMEGLFSDTLYGLGQISEIVSNLKNFSRLDQAAVDNVDINQCVDSALLIAKNVIKHKAEVIREYATLPKVSCTPSQINQVFLNLVTNAAHAIEGHGRISIQTQADAKFVHVVVKDNGKGIPAENLKKIFDPFFTTKPVGDGTGLGLSIVYKIIEDHQGYIRVKSEVGKGTAFCVSLPIDPRTQK